MFKAISYIFIFYSLIIAIERQDIVEVLENYNEAFGKADYSDIVNILITQLLLIFKTKQLEHPASLN